MEIGLELPVYEYVSGTVDVQTDHPSKGSVAGDLNDSIQEPFKGGCRASTRSPSLLQNNLNLIAYIGEHTARV